MTVGKGPIAFLLPNMRGGGAERVALRLMKDALAQGHAVDLLLMAAEGELMPLVPPGVRVIDLHAPRIRNVLAPLIRYFRRERPEGIQISMWPLTSIGVIAHRAAGSEAKVVVSEHIALSKQYGHFDAIRRGLLRQSIRRTYPMADARVAVSAQAADDLAAVSGIARSSITTIYNPVEQPDETSLHDPAVERLWADSPARIITAGSLKAQKNQALLIEAFALVRRQRPAKLMILGEGELREELTALIAARGLGDDVVMPGFVLEPWPYYASADLFALSSDYEGFGLVLVEAMRCGLPVVSTDCEAGPREILVDGAYGRLVPTGDAAALATAMLDTLDAPSDPERQRRRAEEISGAGAVGQYLELMTGRYGDRAGLPTEQPASASGGR